MKRIIILLLMVAFAVTTYGQETEKKKDKIRTAKIEYIKKKLALTANEETKFLPVYNNFLDENEALRKSLKKDINLKDVDLTFMSDEECEKLVSEISTHKQKEVDLIKKYTTEFKKILPIKKVAMMFKAEHEFRRYLVKELRGRSRKMREETRKMREETREMRLKQRKALEESREMLKNKSLTDEERKQIEERHKKLREEIKEQRKSHKKALECPPFQNEEIERKKLEND